jgi:hypothetical protein
LPARHDARADVVSAHDRSVFSWDAGMAAKTTANEPCDTRSAGESAP